MKNGEPENTGDTGENVPGRKEKPPFQLCFAPTQEHGRSQFSKPKLPQQAYIITPKFYSKNTPLNTENDKLLKETIQEIETRREGPREKYREPLLESHKYGWHPEPLVPVNKHDRIHHHHRMTSEMVKVQEILHNAAKAEKEFERLVSTKMKKE